MKPLGACLNPAEAAKSAFESFARIPTSSTSISTLIRKGRPVRVSSALICNRPS